MPESKRYFCPECGRLAEYDPYYKRGYCTFCSWRSAKMSEKAFHNKMKNGSKAEKYVRMSDLDKLAHDVVLEGGALHRCVDAVEMHILPAADVLPLTSDVKPLKGQMHIGQIITGKVVALDAERGLASIKWYPNEPQKG